MPLLNLFSRRLIPEWVILLQQKNYIRTFVVFVSTFSYNLGNEGGITWSVSPHLCLEMHQYEGNPRDPIQTQRTEKRSRRT